MLYEYEYSLMLLRDAEAFYEVYGYTLVELGAVLLLLAVTPFVACISAAQKNVC